MVECLTRDQKAHGFEPHRLHCIVVLEQGTFILAGPSPAFRKWYGHWTPMVLAQGRGEDERGLIPHW